MHDVVFEEEKKEACEWVGKENQIILDNAGEYDGEDTALLSLCSTVCLFVNVCSDWFGKEYLFVEPTC